MMKQLTGAQIVLECFERARRGIPFLGIQAEQSLNIL